jgi:pentatricopeptide repeat protein
MSYDVLVMQMINGYAKAGLIDFGHSLLSRLIVAGCMNTLQVSDLWFNFNWKQLLLQDNEVTEVQANIRNTIMQRLLVIRSNFE